MTIVPRTTKALTQSMCLTALIMEVVTLTVTVVLESLNTKLLAPSTDTVLATKCLSTALSRSQICQLSIVWHSELPESQSKVDLCPTRSIPRRRTTAVGQPARKTIKRLPKQTVKLSECARSSSTAKALSMDFPTLPRRTCCT